MDENQKTIGEAPSGDDVVRYTLSHDDGLEAQVLNYGATLTSLKVPDRHGGRTDVVLGFDSYEPYLGDHPCFGSVIGRCANRISGGTFTLDDTRYTLDRNHGEHHLHGGETGFHHRLWEGSTSGADDEVSVKLYYMSDSGEEGYPGRLETIVTYTLTDDHQLRIRYQAHTNQPTVVNLTNHAYFHLGGEGSGTVHDHEIQVCSELYTPVDASVTPTGEIRPVDDTPLDLREPVRIGDRLDADHEQIRHGGGFDHNFVVNRRYPGEFTIAARVVHPPSGRRMEVLTTTPGVQFYTGNNLEGEHTGKSGSPYPPHAGFCLETQYFPDTPNNPHFPSVRLEPGESFDETTAFRFRPAS